MNPLKTQGIDDSEPSMPEVEREITIDDLDAFDGQFDPIISFYWDERMGCYIGEHREWLELIDFDQVEEAA